MIFELINNWKSKAFKEKKEKLKGTFVHRLLGLGEEIQEKLWAPHTPCQADTAGANAHWLPLVLSHGS